MKIITKNINSKDYAFLGVAAILLGLFAFTSYAQADVVNAGVSNTKSLVNTFLIHSPNIRSFQSIKTYTSKSGMPIDLAVARYITDDIGNQTLTWAVVEEKYNSLDKSIESIKVANVGGVFPDLPLKTMGKFRAEMVHLMPTALSTGKYHFEVCLTSSTLNSTECKISKSFKVVNDYVPSSPLPNPSAIPRLESPVIQPANDTAKLQSIAPVVPESAQIQ